MVFGGDDKRLIWITIFGQPFMSTRWACMRPETLKHQFQD